MIEVDWEELKRENQQVQYIDLTKPAPLKSGDFITIIQYTRNGEDLSASSSVSSLIGELRVLRVNIVIDFLISRIVLFTLSLV